MWANNVSCKKKKKTVCWCTSALPVHENLFWSEYYGKSLTCCHKLKLAAFSTLASLNGKAEIIHSRLWNKEKSTSQDIECEWNPVSKKAGQQQECADYLTCKSTDSTSISSMLCILHTNDYPTHFTSKCRGSFQFKTKTVQHKYWEH
jgi:hypothetical protein